MSLTVISVGRSKLLLFDDLKAHLGYNLSMDENTFAYCAGYIDGDGCFHISKSANPISKNIKYRAMFVLSSTDQEVLKFFCGQFGGYYKLSSDRVVHHKPQYHFYLCGKNCTGLIEKVSPFLVEKTEEASILYKFIQSTSKEDKLNLMNSLKEIKSNRNLVAIHHKELLNATAKTQPLQDHDLAYFAGLIDAECSLGITRYQSKDRPNFIYKAYVHFNNCKLPIFKWLVERFGGSITFINRRDKNILHNNQLSWRISGKLLNEILPIISTFLKHKKPVSKELMKFFKTILENGGDRNSESFKGNYQSILQIRDKIFHKVHRLNLKCINP
jgi:LAGLIDADG DNA endonuclease family protein